MNEYADLHPPTRDRPAFASGQRVRLKPGSYLAETLGRAATGTVRSIDQGRICLELDDGHAVSASADEWEATGSVLPASDSPPSRVCYDRETADLEAFAGE